MSPLLLTRRDGVTVHELEVRFDETYTRPPEHPHCRSVVVELDELELESAEWRLSLAASRARRRRAALRQHRWTEAGLALEAVALVLLALLGSPI